MWVRATSLVFVSIFCGCNEYELKDIVAPTVAGDYAECPTLAPENYTPERQEECEIEPVIGEFNPILEWSWSENPLDSEYTVVETSPIAINLDDDNADGVIDINDIPDLVFPAFRRRKFRGTGHLIALSGATKEPLWIASSEEYPFWGISGVAAGDVDRDGFSDVFAPTKFGLMRLTNEGEMVWHVEVATQPGGQSVVSLADINADGVAEIIMGGAVIDANGSILWEAEDNVGSGRKYFGAFAADIDSDGYQEVISSGAVFAHDGAIRWQIEELKGHPAIGDLDGDFVPEIVSSYEGVVTVVNATGSVLWRATHGHRSGPPTIADFDGDGAAEIGVASKETYTVLDGDGSVLWSQPIDETSSGMTGSSVFDFEGDGAAEVVYADEETLWVFDGASGVVEMAWTEHSSGTRFEYPTIVDIDGDGSAEIILAGGRDASAGIRVIGSEDSSWAPARSIWNQYAYSITNIDDDGTIPAVPEPNWLRWNSFRAGNSETKVGLDVSDLRVGIPSSCDVECFRDVVEVYFPIENIGRQDIMQEITVYVQGSSLEEVSIPSLAQQEVYWVGPYVFTQKEVEDGILVFADVQDWIEECEEENNSLLWNQSPCMEE